MEPQDLNTVGKGIEPNTWLMPEVNGEFQIISGRKVLSAVIYSCCAASRKWLQFFYSVPTERRSRANCIVSSTNVSFSTRLVSHIHMLTLRFLGYKALPWRFWNSASSPLTDGVKSCGTDAMCILPLPMITAQNLHHHVNRKVSSGRLEQCVKQKSIEGIKS